MTGHRAPAAQAPSSASEARTVRRCPSVSGATRAGLLRLVTVATLVALLLAHVGTGAVTAALGSITAPMLLAALAIGAVTTAASAARWCVVARGVGLRLPLGRATAETYRATFLNAVLPAGVLGDLHRAAVQTGIHGAQGARVVVLERAAGQLVIGTAALAVVLAAPEPLTPALGGLVPAVAVLAGLVAALAAAAALVALGRGPRVGRLRTVAAGAVRSLGADVRAGLLSPRTASGVVVLSVGALAGYLALFAVAAAAAGVTAPLPRLLPLLTLALLASALPLSVGGWGPREAASTLAFGTAGLGADQGLAVAVVYGALSLLSCLPGALVLACTRSALRPAARRAAPAGTSAPAHVSSSTRAVTG